MIIILADADPDYLANLSKRLISSLFGVRLFICQSLAEIQNHLAKSDWYAGLMIYNPVDFPEIVEKIDILPGHQMQFWPIIFGNSAAHTNTMLPQDMPVYRFGKAADLAEKIQFWQKSMPSQAVVRSQPAEATSPAASAELHLLLCARPSGYQPAISRRRLKDMMSSGQRVVYLPLMPTYQMSCLSPPGHGPSMSDLLLQLLGKNIAPEHLGKYWQPNPDGYLQFRPPDRSDDLVLCSPELLRNLINLLRDRLNQDTEPGKVLIDCAGLPLATVSIIAVLCTSCEILFPDRECFATDAARREISQMLANLPTSCKILENHQDA